MEQFINSYYENNAKKLHAVINKIFSKNHGGTIGRDMEEFYGIGTDVLVGIWDKYRLGQSTYDPFKGDLDGYVYNALSMAIIDELKKQNCDKRTTKVYLLDGNGNPVLDKKTGKITYGGSARNINHSPIDSFKDIVNSTNILDGRGHANAFGIVDLEIDKKEEALNRLNDILQDVEYDSTYRVDFIMDIDDVSIKIITDLARLEDIIGQGIEEPMLVIENISLTKEQFEIFGKNEDTISFMIDEIKYIQFKCKEGNQLYDWLQNAWDENDSVVFNIVGKPSINEYNGVRTPQIIIEDVVVVSTNNSDDDEEW